MKNWADLLRAIATLLWPLIVLGVLWRFRRGIASLLGRRIRVKLPGGFEAELGEQLDELRRSIPRAQADAAEEARRQEAATNDIVPPVELSNASEEPEETSTIRRILDEAVESPKVGLLSLATEIERELRLILGSRGIDTIRFRGIHGGVAALQEQGALPSSVTNSVSLFWGVRNQLIHGTSDASSNELVRTIDLGIDILRALYAIPRETHTVAQADLALYEDKACTKLRTDVRGVMLESISSNGLILHIRVFPTRQTGYLPGARVSWDWNDSAKWGETWYKGPTGASECAWSASIEFVGQVLTDPGSGRP